ncbi:hypothetical protein L3X38_018751 [Prunus dulcis]|uniref:Uncharacterized protein n=1 Tax=Prunus dulcis TaxID=3755 RepID=A0AAD4W9U5_PRUDU|nr:hypothetical protein L3X38_018751 [Prunus dulcis]
MADLIERLLEYWAEESLQLNSPINLIEMEDGGPEVQDPLFEINVGTKAEPQPLYVIELLNTELRAEIVDLLCLYKDCFAWDNHEMPGLPRGLVEHELKFKDRFKPFQQPSRRFSAEVQLKVKEEILLMAGFIRTARYVEWLANIVPVLYKTRALRVCTNYRNLNLALPRTSTLCPWPTSWWMEPETRALIICGLPH